MKEWLKKYFRRLSVRNIEAHSTSKGASRVEWEIQGTSVWFESRDAVLNGSSESIACLCAAAGSLGGWKIRFPLPLCPSFSGHLRELDKIWFDWWGTNTGCFRSFPSRGAPKTSASSERGIGAFFSLGVDSFYTLLTRNDIDTIIYVGGFDVSIKANARLEEIEVRLRDIGTALGKKVVFLRSNLREHPIFRRLSWEKFHGAALAAAAHLLSDDLQKIMISSSFSAAQFSPWGTSWKTDHLWSSDALCFEHVGQEFPRFQKLQKISDNTLLQAHLHVCWEHRNEQFNCGCCEKCTRTMLGLLALGCLKKFSTLPDEKHLLEVLPLFKFLAPYTWPIYQSFLSHGLPPAIEHEVEELLKRSQQHYPPLDHVLE